MKTNTNYKLEYIPPRNSNRFSAVCFNSCRNLLRQLDRIKQELLRRFDSGIGANRNLLRAALNEAEALAWQTPYPHLFFPALAEEKAAEARRWTKHQATVWTDSRLLQSAA